MSLLRHDVTTNDWVIFTPERTKRLRDYRKARTAPQAEGLCPFCPGNEYLTGPEIDAVRAGTPPNTPGWAVRVIPNKVPALRIEEDPGRYEEGPLFRVMGGCGAHEVIVETPQHDLYLARQPVEAVELTLKTLQRRFNDLAGDRRFQAVVIFKNHGEGAGATLRHPHWQLIATPVVPRAVRLKHAVATDYFDQTGSCLYCVLLRQELACRDRVVAENDHYAAIAPHASHVPFETWILPKEHQSSFGRVEPRLIRPLAALLKTVLMKFDMALEDPDFNLTIHTAPRGDEDKKYFLWHIEIIPRLIAPAGFELGSGMAVNPVLPEEAAAALREVPA